MIFRIPVKNMKKLYLFIFCLIFLFLAATLLGRNGIIDIPWINANKIAPPEEYEYKFTYVDVTGESNETVYFNKDNVIRISSYKKDRHEFNTKHTKTLDENQLKVLKKLVRCMYEDELVLKENDIAYTTQENHWIYTGQLGYTLTLKEPEEKMLKVIY